MTMSPVVRTLRVEISYCGRVYDYTVAIPEDVTRQSGALNGALDIAIQEAAAQFFDAQVEKWICIPGGPING